MFLSQHPAYLCSTTQADQQKDSPTSVLYVLQPECGVLSNRVLPLLVLTRTSQLRIMVIIYIGLEYQWDLHGQQLIVGGISYLILEFLCYN